MNLSQSILRGRLIGALERAARRDSMRRGMRWGMRGGGPARYTVFWTAARVSDFLRRRLGPNAR